MSNWLHDFPLSPEKIVELRDKNPIRIERYRNTMREKRETKYRLAYMFMSHKIGTISKKELLIAGLFLYWGEGTKTKRFSIGFTNTNPNMIIIFIKWLNLFHVSRSKLKIHLHLYSDMDIEKQKNFWSKKLNIPLSQFRKPYIKKSLLSSITYSNSFKEGTCSVILENGDITNKVLMGIKYVQDILLLKN